MSAPVPIPGPPLVSILIVTYTRHELLGRCVESLLRATAGLDVEIVVVVNGVPVREEHRAAAAAGATLVHAPVNLGLSGGLHAARSRARGCYLAVVQDDVVVAPGWLEPLVEALDADPSIGAVTSRVELFDGGLQHEGRLVWRRAKQTNLGDARHPGSRRPVDAGGTASLLVRTSAWDSVGGTDLGLYPLMFVDIDLCLALTTAGWNVVVEPRSVARHERNSSTTERFRTYLWSRCGRRVARRHGAVLSTRPDLDDAAEGVAAQVARCAREAERRRAAWSPDRVPAAIAPVPLDRLVRGARRQVVAVRVGYAVWRLRVWVWRVRRRALRR